MPNDATTSLGGAVAPLTLVTEDGFPLAATRFRALAYSFSDDLVAPGPAVDTLLARFARASIRHGHCTPQALGQAAVGHSCFFENGVASSLWEEVAAFLGEGDAP